MPGTLLPCAPPPAAGVTKVFGGADVDVLVDGSAPLPRFEIALVPVIEAPAHASVAERPRDEAIPRNERPTRGLFEHTRAEAAAAAMLFVFLVGVVTLVAAVTAFALFV